MKLGRTYSFGSLTEAVAAVGCCLLAAAATTTERPRLPAEQSGWKQMLCGGQFAGVVMVYVGFQGHNTVCGWQRPTCRS